MRKINDYDWNYLYDKSENFIKEFVPEANINRGTMTIRGKIPIVDASFPVKGNKKNIDYLLQKDYILRKRGSNINGKRMFNI